MISFSGSTQNVACAKDLPPLDVDAANGFSQSERIREEHVRQHNTDAAELKDLIPRAIHHPDFNLHFVGM
jgi:hypothetical protein